jgi:predicted GNAT family N-acyltransferase
MSLPAIGQLALRNPGRHRNRTDIQVRVVRTQDDMQRIAVVRALVYMAEQDCPYDEEFDGNDYCALHLLAVRAGEPVGCIRLRFFNGFCKLERVCVISRQRGGAVLAHLLAAASELAARKGYRRMLAYIQARLEGMWTHVAKARVVSNATFGFSGYDYRMLEIDLPDHPDAIDINADPYVMLRPEGAWDVPGVLDPAVFAQSVRMAS